MLVGPGRSDVKYTVNSSFERIAYMSLYAVFNDATLTGADQSPNVSARRGEVPGAAVYEASKQAQQYQRSPHGSPPVLGVGSVPHFVL
jgi:hypothetical protein